MCSLYSSEPSEAAGSMRGDGSPFTPLWTKVNFSMTSVPNITAPRRPPPAGVFTDVSPKNVDFPIGQQSTVRSGRQSTVRSGQQSILPPASPKIAPAGPGF